MGTLIVSWIEEGQSEALTAQVEIDLSEYREDSRGIILEGETFQLGGKLRKLYEETSGKRNTD